MYLVWVFIASCKVLNYLLNIGEAHLRLIVVAGAEVFLGISSSTVKEVKHSGFLVFKVVSVYLEFSLNLELLALKSRVDFIR